MRNPPDICGFKALLSPRGDRRWIAVRDARGMTIPPLPPTGRLGAVQTAVNNRVVYHQEAVDRWETPQNTWAAKVGDCEDFVILKRAMLLNAGWPDDDLFMVIGNDLARRGPHAVLVACQGDANYLLDCPGGPGTMMPPVQRVEQFSDFMPVQAHTGTKDWIFGRKV